MAVSFIEMKVFNFPLYAAVLAWGGKPDAKEDAVYHYVKRKLEPKGWNYYRVENTLQNGFPDIVAYKGSRVIFIEAKVCRQAKFTDVLLNFTWQPGQVAFMLEALEQKAPYYLMVLHKENLYLFKGTPYGNIKNSSDFAELV